MSSININKKTQDINTTFQPTFIIDEKGNTTPEPQRPAIIPIKSVFSYFPFSTPYSPEEYLNTTNTLCRKDVTVLQGISPVFSKFHMCMKAQIEYLGPSSDAFRLAQRLCHTQLDR